MSNVRDRSKRKTIKKEEKDKISRLQQKKSHPNCKMFFGQERMAFYKNKKDKWKNMINGQCILNETRQN